MPIFIRHATHLLNPFVFATNGLLTWRRFLLRVTWKSIVYENGYCILKLWALSGFQKFNTRYFTFMCLYVEFWFLYLKYTLINDLFCHCRISMGYNFLYFTWKALKIQNSDCNSRYSKFLQYPIFERICEYLCANQLFGVA